MMTLYQYVIVFMPKDEKEEPKLLTDIRTAFQKDEKALLLKAAKEIPSEYDNCLDQIEIRVRPF